MQPIYESTEVAATHVESRITTALSDIAGTYELPTTLEVHKIAPDDVTKYMELEQQIYATPYKQQDYGPPYYHPPDNEKKIYEEFEGKRFRKLFHREIKLVLTLHYDIVLCLLYHISTTLAVNLPLCS